MNESFSPVGFLYGMAFVLAISKACTLLIWRTLPKPRPPLRQELVEAWHRRSARTRSEVKVTPARQDPHQIADDGMGDENQTQNTAGPIPPTPAERPNETKTPNA